MEPELSLTVLAFLTGLSFAVVSPVLPLYVEGFGVSYEALGLFFSAYSLTWSLLQLYTGYLSDRYGRRWLALIGLAVYSLSALGCAHSYSCSASCRGWDWGSSALRCWAWWPERSTRSGPLPSIAPPRWPAT